MSSVQRLMRLLLKPLSMWSTKTHHQRVPDPVLVGVSTRLALLLCRKYVQRSHRRPPPFRATVRPLHTCVLHAIDVGFHQAIALHSQVITEYCRWVGAPQKVRGLLIRKAKKNGDDLGFLW